MDKSTSTRARKIGQAAMAFEQQTTGRLPSSITVVVGGDTVVITLHGTFSPAEAAAATSPEGAARLRELHRQLFSIAADPLRRQIRQITGVDVREATAEVEASTGTMVQVFSLAHALPTETWSGSGSGAAGTEA